MSKNNRAFTSTNRMPPSVAQQREIAAQTEAFLAKGGEIQQIPNGVSGQPKLGGPSLASIAKPA